MPVTTTSLTTPTEPVEIPTIGFGVWQVPDEEVDAAVATALEVGYRHVDTARLYHNERGVGRALAASDVPREPAPGQDRFVETWRALQQLRDDGRVRAIGTCNFHAEHLQRLHDETGEWPSINQVELHPYLQQAPLRAFHEQRGIVTESWSPLASGKKVLDDPVIASIAAAHDATPAQVVIAWHLALDLVVLPKSVTPSRIAENLAAVELELTAKDVTAIAGLDRGVRTGPNPEEFNGA